MIKIHNLTKSYNKKLILDDFSIDVEEGKIIGIIGKNGCGKSTFLSSLYGIIPVKSGSFVYDGINLLTDSKKREKILAYVPQENALIDELSGGDNLRLWYSKIDLENSLKSGFIKMLGIDEYINLPVKKMSGGMKKRLSLACAIHNNPKIILLDEPTASLDIICRQKIYDYIKEFKKRGGTVLIVTHDVEELELTDLCYLIKNGKPVPYKYDGKISELVKIIQQ